MHYTILFLPEYHSYTGYCQIVDSHVNLKTLLDQTVSGQAGQMCLKRQLDGGIVNVKCAQHSHSLVFPVPLVSPTVTANPHTARAT